MQTYFIRQKNFEHETEKQFIGYTKEVSVSLFLESNKHLKKKDLIVSKKPYFNF